MFVVWSLVFILLVFSLEMLFFVIECSVLLMLYIFLISFVCGLLCGLVVNNFCWLVSSSSLFVFVRIVVSVERLLLLFILIFVVVMVLFLLIIGIIWLFSNVCSVLWVFRKCFLFFIFVCVNSICLIWIL